MFCTPGSVDQMKMQGSAWTTQQPTFNYMSHDALGVGVFVFSPVRAGPAAVQWGGNGAVSLCVSGVRELHRGYGCGFKT